MPVEYPFTRKMTPTLSKRSTQITCMLYPLSICICTDHSYTPSSLQFSLPRFVLDYGDVDYGHALRVGDVGSSIGP